jgi:predicted transglutaminase-like cysteine proteinase
MIGFASYGVATNSAKASQLNSRILAMQQSMVQKVAFHPDKSDIAPLSSYPKLFGASEIASNDISAFTKWTEILGKIDKVAFKSDKTEAFRNLSLDAKITAVNSYVNNFKYIEDKDNYGKTDYWATPNEFFLRGGDCEDFAIAKYSLLKELGVPENRMRLAIVQDKIKNVPHAVLIVYSDNGGVLLDNQIKSAKKVASVTRYKPIYSINAENWWRHIS